MAKKLFILAGPNGSGKSTLYRKLIGKYKTLSKLPFVNPDDIARGKSFISVWQFRDTLQTCCFAS